MDRVRRAGFTALIVIVMVAAVGGWGGVSVLAGVVAWPPSALVISEVQTGGASASDEFVELANQGPGPVDLLGLEVIYATSSGSTVTRKATWATSTVLDPGRRILLANTSGVYSALADSTYSGGFAATGGAIAIRVVAPAHRSRGRLSASRRSRASSGQGWIRFTSTSWPTTSRSGTGASLAAGDRPRHQSAALRLQPLGGPA